MLSGKRERPLFTPGVPLGREKTAGLMTEGKECREMAGGEVQGERGQRSEQRAYGHIFWQDLELLRKKRFLKMRSCGMESPSTFVDHSRETPKAGEFGTF